MCVGFFFWFFFASCPLTIHQAYSFKELLRCSTSLILNSYIYTWRFISLLTVPEEAKALPVR